MDRLSVALLRWAAARMPPGRGEWVEAVLAEADEVPAGRARLSWLVGGLWLAALEVGMIRKIGFTVAGLAVGTIAV
ncbi:MAG: hypothetical protein ABIQ18_43050 [Umezawaea sp.]